MTVQQQPGNVHQARNLNLPVVEPDAHGQAAFMLSETILHALVEKKVFTVDEAIDVVTTSCDIKFEVATEEGESSGRMHESLALLKAIETSLRTDQA